MVTGSSTADLSIILVDARSGVVEQTRRHTLLASLLRVPHLVVAVNKMDLVGWDGDVFRAIRDELAALTARLGIPDLTAIPMSALLGDNVVEPSTAMPWYDGPPLLEYLETVELETAHDLTRVRFPVQWVIRASTADDPDVRAYAGRLEAGSSPLARRWWRCRRGSGRRSRRSTRATGRWTRHSHRCPWPSAWPTTSTSGAAA